MALNFGGLKGLFPWNVIDEIRAGSTIGLETGTNFVGKISENTVTKTNDLQSARDLTQIPSDGSANNATTTIHTVTAGKTFYMTNYTVNFDWTGVNKQVTFRVDNAGDVTQYYFLNPTPRTAAGEAIVSKEFKLPVAIPAGYKIKCSSNDAAIGIHVFFNGWEE